jgi:hypothetical protein
VYCSGSSGGICCAAGEAGCLQPADDELSFWDADDIDMLQLVLHGQPM